MAKAIADADLETEVKEVVDSALEADGSVLGELLEQPETKAAVARVVMSAMTMQRERHRGPLPSPRQLREYEDCLPGVAERIVAMAEREQAHRHEISSRFGDFRNNTLEHVKTRDFRGQIFGTILSLSVIALSFYMVALGFATTAGVLAGGTLVGLAGVFVTRQRATSGSDEVGDANSSTNEASPEDPAKK